jgi:LuxR family maltose regulon positive regulatory protein
VQNLLLNTSILEQVSPDAASELAGDDQAGRILAGLANTNTFVQPLGSGRYRYHTLLAEVLRLKLRHEHPGRVTDLHRRAAGWYQRRGALTEAVRHAKRADGWQAAAGMVIDELAVIEIVEGRRPSLAQAFAHMPPQEARKTSQLALVSAAVALSAGDARSAATALDAAEGILGQLPAEQHTAERLAASMIRLAAARRAGSLTDASAAAASAGTLVSKVAPGELARHPEIPAWVLCNRGAVALWSGHFDEAARLIQSGLAAAATPDSGYVRADCLGHVALAEALRGRLSHASELAIRAIRHPAAGEQGPPAARSSAAALVALAWVHLEKGELPEAGSSLKQANAALKASPDKLLGAVVCLVSARGYLAAGQATLAAPYLASARSGWSVPAWLDQRLSLAEQPAAVTAARGKGHPPAPAQRRDQRPATPSAPAQPAGPLIVEPLTQREREVLRHLSDMLSTAEVASEMYITINTVKAHVKNILRKLSAAHRSEAVRRARQLGLI